MSSARYDGGSLTEIEGMRRFLLTAAVVAFAAATSTAGPILNAVREVRAARVGVPHHPQASYTHQPATYQQQPVQFGGGGGGVQWGGVQWKADVQARAGRMFHPGGGMVQGAGYEGVGFSSASPQDALNHCCNNGGPVVAQAVSHGPGGYYAVKQYGQPGPVQQFTGNVIQATGGVIQHVGPVGSYQPVVFAPVFRQTCNGGNCR